MNSFRSRFKELIANPALIRESDLAELEQIRLKYPWFQAVYPLLAAYHKKEELYSYNRHLKLAALYAGDRSILRHFLEQAAITKDVSENKSVKDIAAEETNQLEASKADRVDPHATLLEEETPKDLEENKIPEAASKSVDIPKEEAPSAEHLATEEPKKEELLTIAEAEEDKVDTDAIATSPSKQDSEEYPILYDPLTELKKLIPTEEKQTSRTELQNFRPIYDPEKELLALIEKDEQEKAHPVEEAHDFLYWLDQSKESNAAAKKSEQPIARIRERIKQESEDASALLENFIRSKPQIRKPKAEFFKAESAAKKSESDDSYIVSESLAKLHLKQAHFDKALEVYEKLLLQNPNRKAYFAARIKEIKEQH